MQGALSLILLCLYKLLSLSFYTLGSVFKLGNLVTKISFWCIDFINGTVHTVVWLFTTSFTVEKKLVYAWGFCNTQRNTLVKKLRSRSRYT